MRSAKVSIEDFWVHLSMAAVTLLARLDKRRRGCCSEAVRNIDFSHSSRLASNAKNNLSGRSCQIPLQCPILANAITTQPVTNRKYESEKGESSGLLSQEVSELWKVIPWYPTNVYDDFTPREFVATLQHLKPGKAPGADSICPEHVTHAGAGIKS